MNENNNNNTELNNSVNKPIKPVETGLEQKQINNDFSNKFMSGLQKGFGNENETDYNKFDKEFKLKNNSGNYLLRKGAGTEEDPYYFRYAKPDGSSSDAIFYYTPEEIRKRGYNPERGTIGASSSNIFAGSGLDDEEFEDLLRRYVAGEFHK